MTHRPRVDTIGATISESGNMSHFKPGILGLEARFLVTLNIIEIQHISLGRLPDLSTSAPFQLIFVVSLSPTGA